MGIPGHFAAVWESAAAAVALHYSPARCGVGKRAGHPTSTDCEGMPKEGWMYIDQEGGRTTGITWRVTSRGYRSLVSPSLGPETLICLRHIEAKNYI